MKNTYISEIYTMFSENGEIHLMNDSNHIIFNARNLLQDLDFILHLAIKEVNKENKDLKNRLKETIKTL